MSAFYSPFDEAIRMTSAHTESYTRKLFQTEKSTRSVVELLVKFFKSSVHENSSYQICQ